MSSESKEVEISFGRCRCCLSYNHVKNMWKEYYFEGKREVYSQILEQCYGLSLEEPDDPDHDQICEGCIKRLRDAYLFRELIIESSNMIIEQIVEENPPVSDKADMDRCEVEVIYDNDDWNFEENALIPKVEIVDEQSKEDIVDESQENENLQCLYQTSNNHDYSDKKDVKNKKLQLKKEKNDMKSEKIGTDAEDGYENVEYLDEDMELKPTDESVKESSGKDQDVPMRKWPKKLRKRDRNRRYKQYTEDDMRNCLEEIRSGTSITEAANMYSIPRKTLNQKIKTYAIDQDEKKDQTYKFHKEIKSILSLTNATPYKSIIVQYSCIYCLKAIFTDAEELRTHTRTMHTDERTKSVDIFMRPHWENEILKLDIDNLLCVICCTLIPDWNEMLAHLTETHNVTLDLAYSRVIPYVLSSDLKCALCKESFMNYLLLDGHMNSHYDNYVCSECGDHFLTRPRLKAHQKNHEVGNFPCEICHKVFGQERSKRKHIRVVHERVKIFKCLHCTKIFPTEKNRQDHMQEQHMDKIKPMNCELCGKVFYWREYYVSHMKKRHGERKNVCTLCGKRFYKNCQLQEHMLSHTGEKTVECPVCHKKYMTKTSLRIHIMNQHKKKGEVAQEIVILKV